MEAIADSVKQIREELMSSETRTTWLWWSVITLAGICNIYQLSKLLRFPGYRPVGDSPRERAYQKWIKVVATCFVVACSFRSFFPVVYATRRCFFSFQSPAVNRALAFVAEVSLPFGVSAAANFFLGSLKDWRFSSPKGNDRALVECIRMAPEVKKMSFPVACMFFSSEKFLDFSIILILLANICCNLGTISKNHWWFVIEESCWAIYFLGTSFILSFLGFHLYNIVPSTKECKLSSYALQDLKNLKRLFLLAFIVFAGGFAVVCFNDLFELRTQALKDCEHIFCYEMFDIDLISGFQDARSCSTLNRNWELWKYAASWQTPYFTLSAMAAIAFGYCPGKEIFRTKTVS